MSELAFRPLGNRVVAEPITVKESKGGIVIPEQAQKTTREAIIVAIGTKVDQEVKVGQKIMFSRSQQIAMNNKNYLVINADDIVGIFND